MKKEYINPEMQVVKMQTMTVLAASDPDVVVSTEGSVDASEVGASQWFGDGDSEGW